MQVIPSIKENWKKFKSRVCWIALVVFFILAGLTSAIALADDETISNSTPQSFNQYLGIDTLIKGYTWKILNQNWSITFWPKSFNTDVVANLEILDNKIADAWPALPDKFSGSIYKIDINTGESVIQPVKSLTVVLPMESKLNNKHMIWKWQAGNQTWIKLDSTTIFGKNQVRANIDKFPVYLVVADDPDVWEGVASWYKYKYCNCAASTIYPKGTKLKVTNISGSARNGKSVIVKVNDYGPDPKIHPDRVIDLDYVAYKAIGKVRGGTMMVRVEKVVDNKAVGVNKK